jgi:branched-chain amino acid transport system ATP-binding protein
MILKLLKLTWERKKLLLSIRNISVHYRKTAAVKDVSMDVEQGTIVTLIGNNGAGKTTTLRAITGLNHPSSGEILFDGHNLNKLAPEKINRLGIAHVPEGRRVFPQMTVLENLEMGAYLRKDKNAIRQDIDMVFNHFPVLKERIKQLAGTMSGGQQQMVAMGRALMSAPKMIVMDEPSHGLAPIMCLEIARIIREINKKGTTIILVEQNAMLALSLADRAYVLDTGNVILEGDAKELKENDDVKKAYLGG